MRENQIDRQAIVTLFREIRQSGEFQTIKDGAKARAHRLLHDLELGTMHPMLRKDLQNVEAWLGTPESEGSDGKHSIDSLTRQQLREVREAYVDVLGEHGVPLE